MESRTVNEIVFSDIPLDFEPHPVTHNLIPFKNERAVKQAVKNLVLMNFYEAPYNGLLGSNILGSLFDNYTPLIGLQIKKDIEQVINNYEPRVDLLDVIVYDEIDNAVEATIVFAIKNSLNPISVSVFLERVR